MKIFAVVLSLVFLAGTFSVALVEPASAQQMKGKGKAKSKPCPPGARRACY